MHAKYPLTLAALTFCITGCAHSTLSANPSAYIPASTAEVRSEAEPALINVVRTGVLPYHMLVARDGSIWYTGRYHSVVVHVTAGGSIRWWNVPPFRGDVPVQLQFVVEGLDGSIWFDYGDNGGTCGAGIGHIVKGILKRFQDPNCDFPWGMAVGRDGRVYVVQLNSNSVVAFDASGPVDTYPLPNGGGFASADFMTSGADGNLWMSSYRFIARMDLKGQARLFRVGDNNDPAPYIPKSIAQGPDGNVWFILQQANGSGEKISKITPSGHITSYPATYPHNPDPYAGLTSGPGNTVWFIDDFDRYELGTISTSGKYAYYQIANKIQAGFSTVASGRNEVVHAGGSAGAFRSKRQRDFVAEVRQ